MHIFFLCIYTYIYIDVYVYVWENDGQGEGMAVLILIPRLGEVMLQCGAPQTLCLFVNKRHQ